MRPAKAGSSSTAPPARPSSTVAAALASGLDASHLDAASHLHRALEQAVASRRSFAARSSVTQRLLSAEIARLERELSQEKRDAHTALLAAKARAAASEDRAVLTEARCAVERRIFRSELGHSERRVVRLCYRLHSAMAAAAVRRRRTRR